MFEHDFDGPRLDPDVWLAHYLPAWSSRADRGNVRASNSRRVRETVEGCRAVLTRLGLELLPCFRRS